MKITLCVGLCMSLLLLTLSLSLSLSLSLFLFLSFSLKAQYQCFLSALLPGKRVMFNISGSAVKKAHRAAISYYYEIFFFFFFFLGGGGILASAFCLQEKSKNFRLVTRSDLPKIIFDRKFSWSFGRFTYYLLIRIQNFIIVSEPLSFFLLSQNMLKSKS